MQFLTYPATVEPGDEGGFVVSFRDAPGAITEGDTIEEALANARDALGMWLLVSVANGQPVPAASGQADGEFAVSPDAEDALKIAVLDAFRTAGISKSELARRLGKRETEARRILDPMHRTKIGTINEALSVLGRRIVVGFEDAA